MDEVEKQIIENNLNGDHISKKKKKKNDNEEDDEEGDDDLIKDYKGKFIKRRALVDQMLMDNTRADFSYAHHKWRWKGANGVYNSVPLADWHRVYN